MRSITKVVATCADVYWGIPKVPFKLSKLKNGNKIEDARWVVSDGGRSMALRGSDKKLDNSHSSDTNSSTAS